ncbi:alpha/beta fold hydrolase [Streptomyces pini]|uniref:Nucleoside-diphosphate-sugar epimerase n=1 Tax=Streptomyces pini TaxID=1520580 RepID=A0A1I4DEY7_9ACTN|nr:alpha/beta fold hydrolase [Streptomyces pini]SFK91479.1 Nucleoside-diphosphate-sugar epimerase [Streptomyces pini]
MTDSIVFGAAGFIGRALVAELLGRGRHVAAAVRGPAEPLLSWLRASGADTGRLTVVTADITRPGLGLPPDGLRDVRDVYNCAARFAFGLDPEQARAVNVTGALNVLDWTASRDSVRRLVHLSGYRVSAGEGAAEKGAAGKAGAGRRADDPGRLGAYESSKREGDTAVRVRAAELGVPLTIANPATVIGPGQFIGLASLVGDLWRGSLHAVPGNARTFLPVVTLEHLTRFLATVPEDPGAAGEAYWILDDDTPKLPGLIALLARHTGTRPPRGRVPVPLLRLLPRRITRADPETLSFLSADRYPTRSATAFARAHGLRIPPVEEALRGWADHLVATRFGAADAPARPYGFHQVADSRTWLVGERHRPDHVLLHGLPLDSDSWTEVTGRLGGPALAADLPGLGRSGPSGEGMDAWLTGLMRPLATRPLLTAHSLACGPALRYVRRHPDRVRGLVLIAPAFLREPSGRRNPLRLRASALRRVTPADLAGALDVPPGPAIDSAAAALHRPRGAARVLAALRAAEADRASLRRELRDVPVPVTLVAGAADPLTHPSPHPVVAVPGAGHYPQLTHPGTVARVLDERFRAAA